MKQSLEDMRAKIDTLIRNQRVSNVWEKSL